MSSYSLLQPTILYLFTILLIKNIDDKNCLEPVYPKCVLSQMVKGKQYLPNLPDGRGHFLVRGGGWGVYVYVCVED